MVYPNILDASLALSRKLYSFAGHSIDPKHTSYCFDKLARAIDYINREPAAVSVSFDGTIWVGTGTIPVVVNFKGTDQFGPVEVEIQLA